MNTIQERTSVITLALIMAFRMLGLFIILPVFTLYAHQLSGATPERIGFALGIYGLTQACLQIPFGSWSDKIGRKPIITLGLFLFALGSVIAAITHTIFGMIIARALQGAGAIGSTLLATISDVTRDEFRSKAMAIVGLTIGFAFTLAMILGPILNAWIHLSGIFWFTAVLAIVGIILLFTAIPALPNIIHQNKKGRFKAIFTNQSLLQLDFGVFSLHAILTAMFIAIPIVLAHVVQLTEYEQMGLYLAVLIIAFFCAILFIVYSERKRQLQFIFKAAIVVLTLTQLLLLFFHTILFVIAAALLVFFCAFTLLEASLPSLVSKIAPIKNKGAAMGIYSSAQFLGIFVGGALGGLIYAHFQIPGIFLFCAALSLLWLWVVRRMQEPPYWSTLIFQTSHQLKNANPMIEKLLAIDGVSEAVWAHEENLLYVKADRQKTSENELRNVIEAGNLAG